MNPAALLCVLASVFFVPAAARADGPGPSPVSGAARALEPGAALALSSGAVDAELGTLDGGPLTRAMAKAAKQGRTLRLLLDPYDQDSRIQSDRLEGLGPAVSVRWIPDMSNRSRWMGLAGLGRLRWTEGQEPRLDPAPLDGAFFDKDWARGWRALPRALRLRDQLDALPDPRERSPHFVRRDRGLP
ncbi:MAG TPA: hypothetical protein VK914_12075 [bacterium]|nr:hypothetical protein [bacterium]